MHHTAREIPDPEEHSIYENALQQILSKSLVG